MADFAKKLTVSFGAFSCTLSGFDNPFPVMRQVVDYFQDLSKMDPSFGAHPERPDTEALRALAEKTSGLSVGAEMRGDEVVLSSVADELDTHDTENMAEDATTIAAAPQQQVEDTPEPRHVTTDEAPAPAEPPSVAENTKADATDAATAENDNMAGVSDIFAQLQLEDLDDEVFENIDAEDIYDAVQPEQDDVAELHAEDVSGYLREAVAFTDVENPDAEDLLVDVPEDAPTATDHAAPETSEMLPIWQAELVSDEPVDEVPEASLAAFEDAVDETTEEDDETLSFEDHVKAEETALSRIIAATQDPEELDASNPLSALREEAQLAEDEAALDHDLAELDDDAPLIGENAAEEARSLLLGFGGAASLDATRHVPASSIDTRTPVSQTHALSAMGIFEEEEDDREFSWDEAPQPTAEVEPEAKPAPLLLTPLQEVTPNEQEIEVAEEPSPNSIIDLDQDDPRADLRRFAQSAGAVSLTDLLEVSAAYSTLVNGRPSFSRGEVLDLLDQFSDEDGFSQEARIKTFGSLLRGGRIQRIENGEYEMTNDALSDYETRRTG